MHLVNFEVFEMPSVNIFDRVDGAMCARRWIACRKICSRCPATGDRRNMSDGFQHHHQDTPPTALIGGFEGK